MARVLFFSTVFPTKHPKKGLPTYFVEQYWNNVLTRGPYTDLFALNPHLQKDVIEKAKEKLALSHISDNFSKGHTIREGNNWKPGDVFSPRFWSARPYWTPQVIFAADNTVKKTWSFEAKHVEGVDPSLLFYFIDGRPIGHLELESVANNDGLSVADFLAWFNKPFNGQIICWNKEINY